jgi:multiple sugar transport system ATP-binding protein
LGSDSFLYVDTKYGLLTAREPGKTGYTTGIEVSLTPQPQHVHRFGDDGKRL